MKAYCVSCKKMTDVRFEPHDKCGRGQIRGFATCCGRVVAAKPSVPPPVCAHGDESRLSALKDVRPATVKIVGRNGRDCLP